MRWAIFKNGEIRGCIVVLWLYRFSRENWAILVLICHSILASICGGFARYSLAFSGFRIIPRIQIAFEFVFFG